MDVTGLGIGLLDDFWTCGLRGWCCSSQWRVMMTGGGGGRAIGCVGGGLGLASCFGLAGGLGSRGPGCFGYPGSYGYYC